MNKKKRRVAVLLSATIGSAVLVLSGCSGKSDQTEKTLRVGVITYTQDDPFINGLTDELKAQLKAMENKERRIIVSTKSGNDDQQEQNEKVEEMIDAGCDVLCINLVDRSSVPDDTKKSSVYAGLRTFGTKIRKRKSRNTWSRKLFHRRYDPRWSGAEVLFSRLVPQDFSEYH